MQQKGKPGNLYIVNTAQVDFEDAYPEQPFIKSALPFTKYNKERSVLVYTFNQHTKNTNLYAYAF